MIGFIYIMSNSAYPGKLKIGQTSKDPEERRKDLGSTGVLEDFVLEYRALSEDFESLEKEIHKSLADKRVRADREFFTITTPEAINKIREIAGDRIESDKVFYVSPEELQGIEIDKETQERRLRAYQRIEKETQEYKEAQEMARKAKKERHKKNIWRETIRRRAREEEKEAQKASRVGFRTGSEKKSRREEEEQARIQAKRKEEADEKWAENAVKVTQWVFFGGIFLFAVSQIFF